LLQLILVKEQLKINSAAGSRPSLKTDAPVPAQSHTFHAPLRSASVMRDTHVCDEKSCERDDLMSVRCPTAEETFGDR